MNKQPRFPRSLLALAVLAAVVSFGSALTSANVVTFEGVVPSGGSISLSPSTPYSEAGLTVAPTRSTGIYSIIGSGSNELAGDPTAFFAFAGNAEVTLTATAGGTFDLQSLVVGKDAFSPLPSSDLTVVGYLPDGSSATRSFFNLTAATTESIELTGLSRAALYSGAGIGIDNITFAVVPEPSTWALLGVGAGWVAGGLARRRQARAA